MSAQSVSSVSSPTVVGGGPGLERRPVIKETSGPGDRFMGNGGAQAKAEGRKATRPVPSRHCLAMSGQVWLGPARPTQPEPARAGPSRPCLAQSLGLSMYGCAPVRGARRGGKRAGAEGGGGGEGRWGADVGEGASVSVFRPSFPLPLVPSAPLSVLRLPDAHRGRVLRQLCCCFGVCAIARARVCVADVCVCVCVCVFVFVFVCVVDIGIHEYT